MNRSSNLGIYAKKGVMINEKSHGWLGEEASYTAKHAWVYRNKGKATKCEECGKVGIGKYIQWANISGKYLRRLEDYRQLCASCHKKQDYARRYGNACRKGHEFTENNTRIYAGRRICKQCQREKMRRIRSCKKQSFVQQ